MEILSEKEIEEILRELKIVYAELTKAEIEEGEK